MIGLLFNRMVWVAIAIAAAGAGGWWIGYSHEHELFVAFKAQVTAAGEAAQKAAKETEQRHEEAKNEIEQEYKDRIASVQRRYADSLRRSNSRAVPATSDPTRRLNAAAANSDPYLVEQCAETTTQLIELQNWIKRTSK
jgi:hypothetical protein